MELNEYIVPGGIAFLREQTKEPALRELVDTVCSGNGKLDPGTVLAAVLERESTISSWIAPGIAIPHARLPDLGRFIVGVGLSKEGVEYDSVDGKPVHLFFLILGDDRQPDRHILLLAEIARMLKESTVLQRILAAETVGEILEIIHGSGGEHQIEPEMTRDALSRMMVNSAMTLSKEVRARAILIHAEAVGAIDGLLDADGGDNIVIVRSGNSEINHPAVENVRTLVVPFAGLNRTQHVELALLFGIAEGLFERGDTVVSVSGTPESGYLDMLRVIDVGAEFAPYISAETPAVLGDVQPQIMERVLQIAMDIAREGREGKPIGAIFVVGDYPNVIEHCQQMVINPFRGYEDDEKSIIDPFLEETVKEFAAIDGAFVIRGDGVVMAAGVYLKHSKAAAELPSGFGARHTAAAGITAVTSAVSVVVSQSTGMVSVFRNGKRILALEKTRR